MTLHSRCTRGIRDGHGPPTFLALKIGVVMYLIISQLARRQLIDYCTVLQFLDKVYLVCACCFYAYGWLYIVLMDLALAHQYRVASSVTSNLLARIVHVLKLQLPTLNMLQTPMLQNYTSLQSKAHNPHATELGTLHYKDQNIGSQWCQVQRGSTVQQTNSVELRILIPDLGKLGMRITMVLEWTVALQEVRYVKFKYAWCQRIDDLLYRWMHEWTLIHERYSTIVYLVSSAYTYSLGRYIGTGGKPAKQASSLYGCCCCALVSASYLCYQPLECCVKIWPYVLLLLAPMQLTPFYSQLHVKFINCIPAYTLCTNL